MGHFELTGSEVLVSAILLILLGLIVGMITDNHSETSDDDDDIPKFIENIRVWTPVGPEDIHDCEFVGFEEAGEPPFVVIKKDGKQISFIGMPYRIDWNGY